jgi:hypothetical protein
MYVAYTERRFGKACTVFARAFGIAARSRPRKKQKQFSAWGPLSKLAWPTGVYPLIWKRIRIQKPSGIRTKFFIIFYFLAAAVSRRRVLTGLTGRASGAFCGRGGIRPLFHREGRRAEHSSRLGQFGLNRASSLCQDFHFRFRGSDDLFREHCEQWLKRSTQPPPS